MPRIFETRETLCFQCGKPGLYKIFSVMGTQYYCAAHEKEAEEYFRDGTPNSEGTTPPPWIVKYRSLIR